MHVLHACQSCSTAIVQYRYSLSFNTHVSKMLDKTDGKRSSHCRCFMMVTNKPTIISGMVSMAVNSGSLLTRRRLPAVWSVLHTRTHTVHWSNPNKLSTVKQVSASPRTQAPTEAPCAPSPIQAGAQLRHWLGPPSPRRSPPNGRSTRSFAQLNASFPGGRPPSQQKEGEMLIQQHTDESKSEI